MTLPITSMRPWPLTAHYFHKSHYIHQYPLTFFGLVTWKVFSIRIFTMAFTYARMKYYRINYYTKQALCDDHIVDLNEVSYLIRLVKLISWLCSFLWRLQISLRELDSLITYCNISVRIQTIWDWLLINSNMKMFMTLASQFIAQNFISLTWPSISSSDQTKIINEQN